MSWNDTTSGTLSVGTVTVGGTITEANSGAVASDLNELTAAPVVKNPVAFTTVVATTGTGIALTAAQTFCRKAYVNARKKTGANTGLVFIGNSDVDKTTDQQFALAPGDGIVLDGGPGAKLDLNKHYADAATSSDCVTGWYYPV